VATITVTPASPSIAVNATQQFTATAKDSNGDTMSGVTFTWASSATSVATINSSGLAMGVSPGTTQITATANGVTSSADTLTVTPGPLATITVSPASPSITVDATQQFTATAKDSSGNTISGLTFTWASSATNVATITAGGLATGLTVGTTTIAAASGAVQGSTTLTVTAPVLVTIAVTPANALIAVGGTQQFTATGTYSDGSTQNLTSTATWSSSATGVATISTTGLASGVGAGQTTIEAASGAINGSTTLTVTTGFVYTGSLKTARYQHTATLLNNGMVLIAGGVGSSGYLASAELY
jgi:hypothetical protein